MVWATSNCIQRVWAHWYAVHGCTSVASNIYTHSSSWVRFWVWVTWGVKKMSLHHGWGWQPSQTAFCIHIRHIQRQRVWAHWYAVHDGHTVAAVNRYPHYLSQIWGFRSLVESKWCQYIIVEGDSHLNKLHPASILHIQSVWAHWYAAHAHMAVASNSYTHTRWVRVWGSSGSLVESKWCHYVIVEGVSHL